MIFVFGSNLAGRHGAGAALDARRSHGAVYGVGCGRTGEAYAIPTKDKILRSLPLPAIRAEVMTFLAYARDNPGLRFRVTRIGCGLAGYVDADIAPMFAGAPSNCHLPDGWRRLAEDKAAMEAAFRVAFACTVEKYPSLTLDSLRDYEAFALGWAAARAC